MSETLSEYLASQEELLQEAALALPHSFDKCTYLLGPIRQAVYLCRTCPESRGICSACSIACHADHDQLELFPKRSFRCDCPTHAIAHPCTLHRQLEDVNESNSYKRNFDAKFCRCRTEYDADKERQAMIQCLSCEDWFHESCLHLRDPPPPEEEEGITSTDDNASDASSSGLPPPLITADDYDAFACRDCVVSIPVLRNLAGTPGTLMVVRSTVNDPWRTHGCANDNETIDMSTVEEGGAETGQKRARIASFPHTEPAKKRPRACLAPPADPLAQSILSTESELGAGDIFLIEGWRDRWCKCGDCLGQISKFPFLLEEEETYEPPEDPDSSLTLEQLGMRALERLPRDKAIEGIHAFNSMREGFTEFLKPFARDGKEVGVADINSFFEELREKSRTKRPSP